MPSPAWTPGQSRSFRSDNGRHLSTADSNCLRTKENKLAYLGRTKERQRRRNVDNKTDM